MGEAKMQAPLTETVEEDGPPDVNEKDYEGKVAITDDETGNVIYSNGMITKISNLKNRTPKQ